jgi:MATE family multidrug resistance protein
MGSGLETLCGQAYGAHQYESVGVYLQAAIFCMLLVCIPVAVLWFNMESLLLLMGQDHEISAMAGMYFGWLVPSLFGVAMLHPLLKFLQSQSVVLPMMLCSLFAFLFHIVLCYILIYTLDVGFIGAALATTISYWLNAIFLMLYIKFSVICKKTWRGLSIETFSAVKPFMKLAIPSAFMIWYKQIFQIIIM